MNTRIITIIITAGTVLLAACVDNTAERRRRTPPTPAAGTPTTMTEEEKDACYLQPYETRTQECRDRLTEHQEAVRAEVRSTTARRPAGMTCDSAVRADSSRRDNRWTQSVKHCTQSEFRAIALSRLNCTDIRTLAMVADDTTAARWWAGIVLDEC